MEQDLSDQHGIAVGAHFTDSSAPQALMDVRGKAILKPAGGNATMGQFEASAVDVAKQMDVAAIPDDIKTFLSDLATLP